MTPLPIPRKLRPAVGEVAQGAALAALLGGNLFGRMAMGPALSEISDEAERGKVLNRAWKRYGNVNSAGLALLISGWLMAREEARGGRLATPARRRLVAVKDVSVAAVAATGVASAVSGLQFSQQAPGGAVPMASGREPAPQTPARAARLREIANLLGGLNLSSELLLVSVDVLLSRTGRRAR